MNPLFDPKNSQALLALGAGLLAPGVNSGERISRGLLGFNQAYQAGAQQRRQEQRDALQQRMMEEQLAEKERQRQAAERVGDLVGSQGGQYVMSDNELFPGEEPIQGLETAPSGLLGGQIAPDQLYASLLAVPGYEGIGAKGLMEAQEADRKKLEGVGPFAGNGIDAQAYNWLIGYNKKLAAGVPTTPDEDMAYRIAHERVTKPYIVNTPDGRAFEVPGMDLSGFAVPGRAGVPQAQPTIRAQPGIAPRPSPQVEGSGRTGPARGREIGKKQFTQDQMTASGFATRMQQAESILADVQGGGYDPANLKDLWGGSVPGVGNFVRSDQGKLYRQAQEDWVRAKLRKESGAVIGADEMADEIKTYFPQPGDTPEVIAQKERARKIATNNLIEQSQGAFGGNPYDIGQRAKPAAVKFLGFE